MLLRGLRHYLLLLILLYTEASAQEPFIGHGKEEAPNGWIDLQQAASHQRPLSPLTHDEQSTPHRPDEDAQSTYRNYTSLLDALHVMQDHFFSVAHGTWPTAIDWTCAVMGTHISATLHAISGYIPSTHALPTVPEVRDHENTINRYFSQLSTFYFGENAFSLRNQAYDDMLWVVLDWLEAIQFIKAHAESYEADRATSQRHGPFHWYAEQFIPQFAHRARVFYDIASKGWDETLCGGGMVWNPNLAPYKNAITNELYIAASVGMYLYFPGDDNDSPFSFPGTRRSSRKPPAVAHDKQYLHNAVKAYDWLKGSGMQNEQGLYADGFHITGWRRGRSNGTEECDSRNEMVYTYNQGVILSGLRGLWEATHRSEYLLDGHRLIKSVIKATGWSARDKPGRWRWAGLGRNGILEEACDWSGSCSQNGQTFKGIFFHHFSIFCAPLSSSGGSSTDNISRPWLEDEDSYDLHEGECKSYMKWVDRNAQAASVTKDSHGEFGEWWGRLALDFEGQLLDDLLALEKKSFLERDRPDSIDYRNFDILQDDRWQLVDAHETTSEPAPLEQADWTGEAVESDLRHDKSIFDKDINDRGRGRTVETQSGGLSVVRAAWNLRRMYRIYGETWSLA